MVSPLILNMEINVKFAGIPVALKLKHTAYLPSFKPFLTDENPLMTIEINNDELDFLVQKCPKDRTETYIEYTELSHFVSDALLPYGRTVYHGLSFYWQNRAWLITGPSGVGKTTHYLNWKLQFNDELTIMNGDKPIISLENEKVIVNPSPWHGKEGMHRSTTAELAGIVLLTQSDSNTMRLLSKREAAAPLYAQVLYSAQNPGQVADACKIVSAMIESVPVWLLSNRGDAESAALCRETLKGAIR